jgi:membrane protein YqaA with SNARE-associated domain
VDVTRPGAYLLLVAVVFGVNLLPAFGPPTWLVLVLFRLHAHLAVPALVLLGAAAAASGRMLLALGTRRVRDHVSQRTRDNLEAARQVVQGSRSRAGAALVLFALSPVPSAQLFEAAGLVAVPLLPLTVAFFSGRLVSYTVYAGGASAAEDTSVGRLLTKNLTSPWAFGLEVLLLLALWGLTRVDWRRLLR